MDGCKFLQSSHVPETQHRPFSSSKRQVRILRTSVQPATSALFFGVADFLHRSPVGPKFVGHDSLGATVSADGFLQEFLGCFLVTCLRHKVFQDYTFMIDGPPKVMPFTIDLHENLIKVSLPVRAAMHQLRSLLADLIHELRPKSLPPKAYCFIAHVDTALMQQVFDIPERQGKPGIHHHSQTDNFWRRAKVAKWGTFDHVTTLGNRLALIKVSF